MRTEYYIAFDAHCRTTDACVKTRLGKLVCRQHLNTTIPHLVEFIDSIPRPRHVVLEESAIAGWLYRQLKSHADETIVCDPRRNAYVAKDGDKDDPIDAQKLNDLARAGFLRVVHQKDTNEKAAAKQLIGMYHDRVARRVEGANRLLSLGKRWGLLIRSVELDEADACEDLVGRFTAVGAPALVGGLVKDLHESYMQSRGQEDRLFKLVCDLAAADPMMKRVKDLPGYGPIRSATLVCYLDTPWRFKGKSALWKYVGIGLKREKSSNGPTIVKVEQACNHLLRNVVIGAAQSAIRLEDNAFARRYRHWIKAGLSPLNARRNVARDQVTAIWGMWKSDSKFDPAKLSDPEKR